jgi:hypothetical protein
MSLGQAKQKRLRPSERLGAAFVRRRSVRPRQQTATVRPAGGRASERASEHTIARPPDWSASSRLKNKPTRSALEKKKTTSQLRWLVVVVWLLREKEKERERAASGPPLGLFFVKLADWSGNRVARRPAGGGGGQSGREAADSEREKERERKRGISHQLCAAFLMGSLALCAYQLAQIETNHSLRLRVQLNKRQLYNDVNSLQQRVSKLTKAPHTQVEHNNCNKRQKPR